MEEFKKDLLVVESKIDMLISSMAEMKETQNNLKQKIDQFDGARKVLLWIAGGIVASIAFANDIFKFIGKVTS